MKAHFLFLVPSIALLLHSSILSGRESVEIEIGDTVHLSSTYQLSFKPTSVSFIEEFGSIPDYAGAVSDSVNIDASNFATMYFSLTLKDGAEIGTSYNKDFSYLFYNSTESKRVYFSYSLHTPIPLAASFNGDKTSGSYPLNVQFTNTSTGDITNYSWDFGDDSTSTEENPIHTYTNAGAYSVSLTVANAGETDTETKTDYILVTDPTVPVAEFSGLPITGEIPLTVQFSDNSTGEISDWLWDFGDGATSEDQNPNHTYSEEGTFTVSLTVSGAGGTDTEIKTDYITVPKPHVNEPGVIFDPELFDPEMLPSRMSIVTLDGEKYLKVNLEGWSNTLLIDSFDVTQVYSHVSFKAKYEVVSSGYPFNTINTFLKLTNTDWTTEIVVSESPSSEDFRDYHVPIDSYATGSILQVAGHETTNWDPTYGDIMWVGKLMLTDRKRPTRPDNLIATVEDSKIILSWHASTDNAGIAGYIISQNDIRLDSITSTNYEVSDMDNGTYTFSVVSVDLSGNLSGAEKVNVTVGPTILNDITTAQLNMYPNPANTFCIVEIILEKSDKVKIQTFNSQGQLVQNISHKLLSAGKHTLDMDISDLPEGLYYISVATDSFNSVQKLMIDR